MRGAACRDTGRASSMARHVSVDDGSRTHRLSGGIFLHSEAGHADRDRRRASTGNETSLCEHTYETEPLAIFAGGDLMDYTLLGLSRLDAELPNSVPRHRSHNERDG